MKSDCTGLRAAALAAVLVLALAPSDAANAGASRAIWIWEASSFRMLDEPDWRDQVFAILAEHGFDTLYLYADSWHGRNPLVDEPEAYAALIRAAHGRGLRVEALLGSAYLQTNRYVLPEHRGAARDMLDRVLTYNRAAAPEAAFDAIQLDIEPYTLDEWDADRNAVAAHFAEAAQAWAAQVGPELVLGAAIPFWFDRVEFGDSHLADVLQGHFDYVALMDYRDQAEGRDGIIRHAHDEVVRGSQLGKPVIVGVETDAAELDKLSFAEEGPEVMAQELAKVEVAFKREAGFGGIAIHYLCPWLELTGQPVRCPARDAD